MEELVELKKNEIVCNSLQVAEKFRKEHRTVIRSIETSIQNCADVAAMFQKSSYKDSYGRKQPMYFMNRDGFSLIAMGFTGKKALEWKLKYIQAFNEMERRLKEKQSIQWQETRLMGKLTRKAETDVLKKLIEYAKGQGSEHADKLYITYTKLANKIAGVQKRDEANIMQLNNLTLIENIILNCIQNGMQLDKHYKIIYQDCKQRLETFKDIAYLEAAV